MDNTKYWQKREIARQNNLMKKADDFIDDMRISYKNAFNNIEKDINSFFKRFATNDNITLSEAKKKFKKGELDKFKMSINEYIKLGQNNFISNKWANELEIASNLYHIDRLKALQLQIGQQIETLSSYKEKGLTKTLKDIYEDGYYRGIFDIQQYLGVGTSFEKLDTKKINDVLSKPWTYDNQTYSKRIWENNDKLKNILEKNLTQGIIKGESSNKIINQISKEMDIEYNNTRRLVLTESAAISSRATIECYRELNIEKYEILSTLDLKTSSICQELDGKRFEEKEYKIGITAPPFHPYCRTTIIPYFDDEFTEREKRIAKGEDGKNYYVPLDMKYDEWFDKYVDISLTIKEEGAIIRYISSGAYVLNEKLRHKIPFDEDEKIFSENLDSALKKMPYYKGNLVRSIDITDEECIKEYISKFKIGDIYNPKYYLSTTKGSIYNKEAKIQVYIKNSSKGRDISTINVSEQEILYERNTKFKVIEIVENEDKYFILLEEIYHEK